MPETIYTIGHSTHPRERFIELLQQHSITAVCDVRSKPYSRMNPQFNREELEHVLPEHGIAYRFFGRELGARTDDPSCYVSGRVRYERLAETALFRQGLDRLINGMKQNFRISLMCAEKEPLECHRTILVARRLAERGFDIQHIHADGHLESHTDAVARLAQINHVPETHLFLSPEELLAETYLRQEERIAFEADA